MNNDGGFIYTPDQEPVTIASRLPLNHLTEFDARFGSAGEEEDLYVVPRAKWEELGRPTFVSVSVRAAS